MDYRLKISGLILNENSELLLFRSIGKTVWTCPGGKVEEGESDIECLTRELKEEAMIDLEQADFLLETPIELAAGSVNLYVKMRFYVIKKFNGKITNNPNDNVEEFRWISKSEFLENLESKKTTKHYLEIGSGLELYAIPKLIELNLM